MALSKQLHTSLPIQVTLSDLTSPMSLSGLLTYFRYEGQDLLLSFEGGHNIVSL